MLVAVAPLAFGKVVFEVRIAGSDGKETFDGERARGDLPRFVWMMTPVPLTTFFKAGCTDLSVRLFVSSMIVSTGINSCALPAFMAVRSSFEHIPQVVFRALLRLAAPGPASAHP